MRASVSCVAASGSAPKEEGKGVLCPPTSRMVRSLWPRLLEQLLFATEHEQRVPSPITATTWDEEQGAHRLERKERVDNESGWEEAPPSSAASPLPDTLRVSCHHRSCLACGDELQRRGRGVQEHAPCKRSALCAH